MRDPERKEYNLAKMIQPYRIDKGKKPLGRLTSHFSVCSDSSKRQSRSHRNRILNLEFKELSILFDLLNERYVMRIKPHPFNYHTLASKPIQKLNGHIKYDRVSYHATQMP